MKQIALSLLQLLAFIVKPSTLGFQLSIFNLQLLALNFKLSTLSLPKATLSTFRFPLLTLAFALSTFSLDAQNISINTDGSAPDPSAMLDVSDTTKGLLIPRLTLVQRNAITNPATGLLIFQINTDSGFYFNQGTPGSPTWLKLVTSAETSTSIRDADNDTKIQVEESGDEDIIRFDQAGTEFFRMDSGRLEVVNSGDAVFLGEGAGENDDFSSNSNTGIGTNALRTNVAGENNVAFGKGALGLANASSRNTAIGSSSMSASGSTAFDNVAVGYQSLLGLSGGDANVSVGTYSLASIGNGSGNTALGYNSGNSNNGSNNLFLGNSSGSLNTGSNNVFIGASSGQNEIGSNLLYIENSNSSIPLIYGDFANDSVKIFGTLSVGNAFSFPTADGSNGQVLQTNGGGTIGWTSVPIPAIVQDADNDTKIQVEESGDEDIIRFDIGGTERWALEEARLEPRNTGNSVFIGDSAGLNDDFTANNNIGIGKNANKLTTTGSSNIAIGVGANEENTFGVNNISIGENAGKEQNSGGTSDNILIGKDALKTTNSSNTNVVIGNLALRQNASGNLNTVIGHSSLQGLTNGNSNTTLGYFAGVGLSSGESNVLIGNSSLAGVSNADSNVVIGAQAGTSANVNKSILLGVAAGQGASGTGKLYIENSNSATPLIYGDFENDSVKINGHLTSTDGLIVSTGKVGIGTSTPESKFTVTDTTTTVIRANTYASALFEASVLNLVKYRGTEASPAVLVNNDEIGRLSAFGYDGTNPEAAAKIEFAVDGNPGNDDMPGRIQFHTTADGANTATERMRITSEGTVGIGTSTVETDALLELNSSTRAFLPPRLTSTEILAIANPVEGMMVYNKTASCPFFYDGSAWVGNCGSSTSINSISSNAFEGSSEGGAGDDYGKAIYTDASDNYYVTGYFEGSVTYEGNGLTSTGGTDIFIAKYNSSETLQWVKSIGGLGDEQPEAIVADNAGNIFVTGSFEGTVDFDPGVANDNLTSAGGFDAFVLALDASGNYLWAEKMGSAAGGPGDYGYDVATDGINVYMIGSGDGTVILRGIPNVNCNNYDPFVVKINIASGNPTLGFRFGNANNNFGYGIEQNNNGELIIVGSFEGTVTFGAAGNETSVGGLDAFTAKVDTSGVFQWVEIGGGLGDDEAKAITLDNANNAYITGYFDANNATFGGNTLNNNSQEDVFVAKYNTSGTIQWALSGNGSGVNFANSIWADNIGNLYIGGTYTNSFTFGGATVSSNGSSDSYIAKYLQDGTALWVRSAGNDQTDQLFGVSSSLTNDVARATGGFRNTVSFGSNTLSTAGNEFDVYIWKFTGN